MKTKKTDWKMKALVILGIIILPLIYSLFYLKGFWDPYNSLDNVSVALVNLDQCEKNCKGTQLVKELKKDGTFDFKVVSEKEADEGLINKKYYATIKIPKDFTSSLEKASTKDRSQAVITYSPNTKTNYVVAQFVGMAVTKIEAQLQSNISKEVTSSLVNNLQSVPEQTQQISDALGTIYNGTNSLKSGTNSLNTGLATLNTSYKTFNNGIEKLKTGSNTLYTSYQTMDSGINTLYDSVHNKLLPTVNQSMTTLNNGISSLKNSNDSIIAGTQTYQTQLNQFIDNTNSAYEAINTLCNETDTEGNTTFKNNNQSLCQIAAQYTTADTTGTTGVQKVKAGMQQVINSQTQLGTGIQTISTGLNNNVSTLNTSLQTLDDSILKLKNGSASVLTGIESLKNGLSELSEGSKQIDSGINTLSTGSTTLNQGASSLSTGVKTAKDTVDEKITETKEQTSQLTGLDDYTEDPVKVKQKNYGEVNDYGTFFSPYFMSLSLWIGGILILMGLYYDPDHRFQVLGRNSENRGKRLVLYNVIGIIQAIILAFTLKLLLGFEVTNLLVYYGSCILISEAFLAIIMFLFFNFQDIGKFLSLVFLVLQLAACGGTFPVETEPALYQAVYPFMPMTYSVDLLRESFVSINSNFLCKDVIILLSLLVIFNALIFVTSLLKTRKEQRQKAKQTNKKTQTKKRKK